ncbi:unnamed protein product [Trichobilharzia szidati]|nr:unnamed protein product [Trichobilharzia szidati]
MLTVFTTCFGSSFQIGYNLAILNQPAKNIENFLKETMPGSDPQFIYVTATAIFVVAAAMGSFSCGWIADGFGRRNGLFINHFFAITSGLLIGPCVALKQPMLLLIGRVVIGINCGITIGVASLYLTEIAPRELRGGIGACHQLAVTIGIAFAYFITLSFLLNSKNLWPLAAALGAVPATISLILLPMCPESPRFLFLKKHKETEARNAFLKLNIQENVDTFLSELQKENEFAKSQPAFKFQQLFVQKDLRVPVVIACLIQMMQQLSGINAVISYSSKMLTMAGISESYLEYCVFGIGVFNVIVTIGALPLLERAGRRTLLLWPSLILVISLLVLTISVTLTEKSTGTLHTLMTSLSIIFIFVYIFGFALGLGPVPALIVSEIFRQGPRAAAYSLSQTIQWLSNLLVLFSTPTMMVS